MKYTIISRDEFLKLIKFGTIYQNINYIVDEKNQQKVISKILKALPYDDPFGYVVVEFTYEESFFISHMQTLVKLDIKDIINIYCLTSEALDFYKTKFNPNIKFKLFEKEELIKDVTSYKLIEDKQKGVEALFKIFNFDINNIKDKFNNHYIKELLEYKEKDYLYDEYKDFYFDLFCYERKNSFFKEDIGYIADLRAVSKMKSIRKNKEIFLSGNYTNLSKEEDKENIQLSFKELIIETIIQINKLEKKTEEKKETIRNLVIGAIFLKSQKLLNTESREQNYWENFINLINEFKEEFLEETKEALSYLGVFLGYKYLYDDYYNFLGLNIFKEEAEPNNILTSEEEQKSELTKLKQEYEELSKKITHLENSTQKLEPSSQDNSTQNNENASTGTEIQIYNDGSSQLSEFTEKQDERFNDKENNQEPPETQNQQKKLDNEAMNKEYFQFTDEEITKFSLSHLQEIAKERGVDQTASKKKFPNSPEGKIALYKAIKTSPRLDIKD